MEHPITSFLHQHGIYQLPLLVYSFHILTGVQKQQGYLLFDDIVRCFAGTSAGSDHLLAYASLLYEGLLVPLMVMPSGPALSMKEEIVQASEEVFLQSLLCHLEIHARKSLGERSLLCPTVEALRQDIQSFAGSRLNGLPHPPPLLSANAVPPPSTLYPEKHQGSNLLSEDGRVSEEMEVKTKEEDGIEKNEFVARFLAHLRRTGMDLIIPQISHDKLLLTIFIALKCANALTHRELMDMIFAVKEAGVITEMEIVSKTKVRGILSLLKNSSCLSTTNGGSGESVKVFVTNGITSFTEFRETHDLFLSKCLLQHHMFLPVLLKGELFWNFEEESGLGGGGGRGPQVALRLQVLEGDQNLLSQYFLTGHHQHRHGHHHQHNHHNGSQHSQVHYGLHLQAPSNRRSPPQQQQQQQQHGFKQERSGSFNSTSSSSSHGVGGGNGGDGLVHRGYSHPPPPGLTDGKNFFTQPTSSSRYSEATTAPSPSLPSDSFFSSANSSLKSSAHYTDTYHHLNPEQHHSLLGSPPFSLPKQAAVTASLDLMSSGSSLNMMNPHPGSSYLNPGSFTGAESHSSRNSNNNHNHLATSNLIIHHSRQNNNQNNHSNILYPPTTTTSSSCSSSTIRSESLNTPHFFQADQNSSISSSRELTLNSTSFY